MRSLTLLTFALGAVVSMTACSKDECAPNESRPCTCAAVAGKQACAQGKWGACDCSASGPATPPGAGGLQQVPADFCRTNCLGVFNSCKNAAPDPSVCEKEHGECLAKCPP